MALTVISVKLEPIMKPIFTTFCKPIVLHKFQNIVYSKIYRILSTLYIKSK